MTYTVKEIFRTLQGDGAQSGRPAVFLRFSGCNLWSGREEDRATADCTFCDTDFVGVGPDGGKFETPGALAAAAAAPGANRVTAAISSSPAASRCSSSTRRSSMRFMMK